MPAQACCSISAGTPATGLASAKGVVNAGLVDPSEAPDSTFDGRTAEADGRPEDASGMGWGCATQAEISATVRRKPGTV
jgi:hypothetical protein